MHQLSDVWVLRIAGRRGPGVDAFLGFDRRIVPHQGLPVFGDDDVEFECADAEFE